MDPTTLKYTPTHEWVHLDGDVATWGSRKFAVDQLTDLIVIDLPKVGATLTAGKTFGEVESVKAVSDLYAPVGGEVVEVNDAVAKRRPDPRRRPVHQGLAGQGQGGRRLARRRAARPRRLPGQGRRRGPLTPPVDPAAGGAWPSSRSPLADIPLRRTIVRPQPLARPSARLAGLPVGRPHRIESWLTSRIRRTTCG